MDNKKAKYTFKGINQDIAKSKHPFQYYYDAQHIRILATDSQSTGSITNEKGNKKVISIPDISINKRNKTINYNNESIPYINDEIDLLDNTSTNQVIIGTEDSRTGIIIFTTDSEGMDCIWHVPDLLDNQYDIKLLYIRNLNFSIENPIQALFNYENNKIQKVYWVDGRNQLRFLNLNHSIENGDLEELIDIDSNTINFVGNFNLSQPIIEDITFGGNHTAGTIQYAYNLYNLNSSQTTLSPLSTMVALDKGFSNGGGEVNEITGTIPILKVEDIDPNYNYIKIYSVKYTSFNEVPKVSLILERELDRTVNEITYFDDGRVIKDLTLEEFIFLGANPIIPRHIEAKDNTLFAAAIKEVNFDIDVDTRAYSYLENSDTAYILNNAIPTPFTGLPIPEFTIGLGGEYQQVPSDYDVAKKYDCVNPNYDKYRYQKNSTKQGGEGKYIKYYIDPTNDLTDEEIEDGRFNKSSELARIGIQFYNKIGQKSFPKWIADFKADRANLNNTFNTLKVELTPEFYIWLNDSSNFETENDKPIGYKILKVKRGLNDRSVLYQGILSPMIFQVKGSEVDDDGDPSIGVNFQDEQSLKMPSYFMRNFEYTMQLQPFLAGLFTEYDNYIVNNTHLGYLNDVEIHSSTPSAGKLAQTFQFSKMMQLHSPEVAFDFSTIRENLKLKINGLCRKTAEYVESKEVETITELDKKGGKFRFYDEDNPTPGFVQNNDMIATFRTPGSPSAYRYLGPSGDDGTVDFYQYYREYNKFEFAPDSSYNSSYDIYGKPELANTGADRKSYNGDNRYNYANSLKSFISDGNTQDGCDECEPINSINSWSNKNLTLMLGTNAQSTNDRIGLETLKANANIPSNAKDGVLSVEVTLPNINLYLGNLYGGNTYESKSLSEYIEIGKYSDINNSLVYIKSPGDTFVYNYKFLRIGKTDTQVLDSQVPQLAEIVSYPVETTVDLKNRNDLSLFEWDNRFQPRFDEFNKYNRVYSQEGTLITNTSEGFNFKKVENFDSRIIASKTKIPGEPIDSWTDILINEVQDLDGKYGPINGLVNYKDNLFTFQDEAIAALSINPRVQVQGSDGIGVELGTGSIFYDYNYLTTKSGSINKWGIVSTKKGIYYYDALNKAIGRVPDAASSFLSDIKGLHTFFNENYNYNVIKEDNPLLKKGAIFGYDNYNNDVYFTLLQDEGNYKKPKSFTKVYNEMIEEFIDKKKYLPTGYIYKGEKLLLTDSFNKNMYEQFQGEYNKYFNKYEPSYVTLQLNPESDYDTIFNNVFFNSEVYINDVDIPNRTLTHIRAFNEYQDSGKIPLIVGRDKNLRRKFREWKAIIPRDGRKRIRNPWIFLKLEFDNTSNYKLILHDIIIQYTI